MNYNRHIDFINYLEAQAVCLSEVMKIIDPTLKNAASRLIKGKASEDDVIRLEVAIKKRYMGLNDFNVLGMSETKVKARYDKRTGQINLQECEGYLQLLPKTGRVKPKQK